MNNKVEQKKASVMICGVPYDVLLVPDLFDATDLHLGQIEYANALIKINSTASARVQRATLCHEILHGLLAGIGRDDLAQDEAFVSALGNAINEAFIVNTL